MRLFSHAVPRPFQPWNDHTVPYLAAASFTGLGVIINLQPKW